MSVRDYIHIEMKLSSNDLDRILSALMNYRHRVEEVHENMKRTLILPAIKDEIRYIQELEDRIRNDMVTKGVSRE